MESPEQLEVDKSGRCDGNRCHGELKHEKDMWCCCWCDDGAGNVVKIRVSL